MSKALFAEEYATMLHKGQTRKHSDLPYIVHPIAVAEMVQQYTKDEDVIAAAYLHDVVEYCNVTIEDLIVEFGFRVAKFVGEVTNTSKNYVKACRADRKLMDRQHIAKAGAEGQLIKVCDRICNLEDLKRDYLKHGIFDIQRSYKDLYTRDSYELAAVLTRAPSELICKLIGMCNNLIGL